MTPDDLPAHQRAAGLAFISGQDPYARERAARIGQKIAYIPVRADRRTATDILGPLADPLDPNDPQQHGWDPDGPGDREREDRP